MKVHVLEARNLTAADSDGTSDPYAVLHLSSDESATQTTKTVSSSLNPEWGEVFTFDGGREADSLTVRVYDYDYIGRDDPIGEVQISVQDAARQFLAHGSEGDGIACRARTLARARFGLGLRWTLCLLRHGCHAGGVFVAALRGVIVLCPRRCR